MTQPILQVNQLTTRFRTDRGVVTAVDQVSFDVAPGETLAIVGESGSGKSVTALSILGLIPSPAGRIESGEILFDGQDLLKLSPAKMRAIRGNRIAMIFQEPMSSMNPALTVGKQIAEPINLHQGMPWKTALGIAGELLGKVQIPEPQSRLGAYPHQFSGGMRQRAMIAMALACKPQLIIADEPTTALDVTVQAQILDLLKDLASQSGTALVLITHDLGVVARYADRVAVIRDTWARFGTMIDTHTADGLQVARAQVQTGVPMIVLETALPIKFAATIEEALGRLPDRPAKFEGIEDLPKRVTDLPADAEQVKAYIARHCD